MNKKAITWAVLAVILVVLIVRAVNSGSKSVGSNEPIKIGAIAPLTGWGAYWGEGYVKGINLALADIKAAGGHLEVIIEDGGTDATKSASAAHKLIGVDKVDAITVEFTGPTSSVSPIVAAAKLPLIYDALPKKFLSDNLNAFKMYFDIAKQCFVAANYLASHGAKNIGGMSINLDFMPECKASIEQVAKEKNIKATMYSVPTETTDFRTIIAKMKSDGVDAIVPVFYEDNATSFFKQKSDLKFNVPVFMGIGNPDGFTEKVRTSVPPGSIEGVIAYDQPVSQAFKDKLAKMRFDLTEKDYVQAAYGYDEIAYLYGGLSKCNRGDSACVIAAMKADHHVGALGTPGFNDDRTFQTNLVYYKFTAGKLVEFKP